MVFFWALPGNKQNTSGTDAKLRDLDQRMAEFLSVNPGSETRGLVKQQQEAVRAELRDHRLRR